MSPARRDILDLLHHANRPMSPAAIAAKLHKARGAIYFLLSRMRQAGEVRSAGRGLYLLSAQDTAKDRAKDTPNAAMDLAAKLHRIIATTTQELSLNELAHLVGAPVEAVELAVRELQRSGILNYALKRSEPSDT